ncbi:hypothetical protein [Pseudoxanthomonas sp. JBR18]|uniref:hypothetical protein n=1 Tax=Pseudoxanthomonas sp. JBR18 TaxID=2969308 RepID=UPI002306BA06|nr:hypothetical protein [Pseudoxanthomonas sp. JBR18]WCE05591.1 hypothetical protein PJ250_06465 [Pseudoxanthomonas sp. JBR18]
MIADVGGLQLQGLRAHLFDAAAGIAQGIGLDLQAPRVERACAIVQISGRGDRQFARGAERSRIGDAAGSGNADIVLRLQRAGILEATLGRDHQLPCLGSDLTGVADAHPMLVADQPDLVGEHASQCADVQRQGWGGALRGDRLDVRLIGADLVRAQGGLQLIGPDSRIDLQRARDQVGVVRSTGIQPGARHLDRAAVDAVALQCAT